MQPFATRRVCIPVTDALPAPDTLVPRVLLVSADPDLRSVLTRVLQREGYHVDAVAHSGHALLLCRTAEFDVLVAELCSPDISGPSLAEQVRRQCPRLSAVYLGSPGTPEGVDNLLVRPFTRDDLLERVHNAVSRAGVPAG